MSVKSLMSTACDSLDSINRAISAADVACIANFDTMELPELAASKIFLQSSDNSKDGDDAGGVVKGLSQIDFGIEGDGIQKDSS